MEQSRQIPRGCDAASPVGRANTDLGPQQVCDGTQRNLDAVAAEDRSEESGWDTGSENGSVDV
jgi:hypothetical protein